jgi:hypothetical protein
MADPVELMLDEARRKLERQGDRLNDVRARSGALLASAAVVTSLFGFRLGGHHNHVHLALLIAALAAFAGVLVLTVAINWPASRHSKSWSDGAKLDRWISWAEAGDPQTDVFGLALAKELHDARAANVPMLDARMRWFRWECVALGIEVLCWALATAF